MNMPTDTVPVIQGFLIARAWVEFLLTPAAPKTRLMARRSPRRRRAFTFLETT